MPTGRKPCLELSRGKGEKPLISLVEKKNILMIAKGKKTLETIEEKRRRILLE